jgi:serine/threonine protein kinase HipA of HipAB toxin-antitoxin module
MTQNPDKPAEWAETGRTAAQECAAIEADLERLKALVSDAAGRLLGSFHEIAALEDGIQRKSEERARVQEAIAIAVTALQFQDMATQLTGHAQRRLLALESCLRTTYGDTATGVLMERAQPVRQTEMSAGSIDLF